MEQRLCLDCGSKIKGRADKKFCNDQCRNNYNNYQNSDANSSVRNINNMLRKNRRILEELVAGKEGKTTVPWKKLTDRGYNFTYHTHTYTTKAGAVYFFCYEYGYLPLEANYYMLVKWQEHAGK